MLVVGLWHEANLTYVVFGLYHGLLFVPLVLSGAFMKKDQLKTNRIGLPNLKDFGRMLLTFGLVLIGRIIARSDSVGMAWEYFCGMMQFGTLRSSYRFFVQPDFWPANLFIVVMLVVEWLQRSKEHGLEFLSNIKLLLVRCVIVVLIIEFILIFKASAPSQFIYFQF